MLIFIANGQPVPTPYVDGSGNQYPPNLEQVWSAAELAAIGIAVLVVAAAPSFNPFTQSRTQNAAPTLLDGVWTLGWTVASLTSDQVKANVTAQLVAQAPVVAASYVASLQRKATTLQAKGQTWQAVQLLLQAQGIPS